MNITLYKAAEEVRHLLEQVDPETGELRRGERHQELTVDASALAQVLTNWGTL